MDGRHRFKERLNRKVAYLIALHVTPHKEQWRQDIRTARLEGVDGIILVRDYTTLATNEDVLYAYIEARKEYPRWFVGLNLLGYSPSDAVLAAPTGVSGLWFDQPYIDEDGPDGAKYFAEASQKSDIRHLPTPPVLIPSVAMKHQPQPKSLTRVARLIEPYCDVIVTSGTETGKPPSIEKIRELRRAVGCPVGIVSGIDIDNVRAFIDEGVDCLIMWSSLAKKWDFGDGKPVETLDVHKVGQMRDKIPR